MELRHLRYFVTVAEELSFTRAARRLHIAQPPLSQQIRDLEEELGVPLFDRAGRSIFLTQAGKELLAEARGVLDGVEKLKQRAHESARGETGQLTIGLSSALATPKFASMIRTFQKRNPGIRISLGDHSSGWQVEALGKGELDIGFLRPPKILPGNIDTFTIKRQPMKLAVSLEHPFAKQKQVDWKDLKDEAFILVQPQIASPDYYSGFFELCRKAGFEPSVQQYTMNVATQIWMVSAGLGIAPMPITPDIDKPSGVVFVNLPKDAPVFETAMAWRGSDPSAVLKKFLAFAKESIRSK